MRDIVVAIPGQTITNVASPSGKILSVDLGAILIYGITMVIKAGAITLVSPTVAVRGFFNASDYKDLATDAITQNVLNYFRRPLTTDHANNMPDLRHPIARGKLELIFASTTHATNTAIIDAASYAILHVGDC